MGKVTWHGWVKVIDPKTLPQPTGPVVKRDGTKVITITVPPREAK